MSTNFRLTARLVALSLAVGCAWLGQPATTRAQLPLGEEFQVNSYTTNRQNWPALASHPDGSFVVVWSSYGQDGSSSGIFGQRYDADGNPLASEFQVNSYTTGLQTRPAVASDTDGNFVVAWSTYGSQGGIFGQRYDAAGNPLGGEFQVDQDAGGEAVDVATDGEGNFVVAWSRLVGSNVFDVFGRRFDASGNPLGGEFQVNSAARDFSRAPALAVDEGGSFIVAWTGGYGGFPSCCFDVMGRRYDAAGNPIGGEFRVNTFTPYYQGQTAVAMDGEGEFVVVWASFPIEVDGNGARSTSYGINGQRFDSEGNAVGGEFHVADQRFGYSGYPKVAFRTHDEFVVVWNDRDGSEYDVSGRLVDTSGALLGSEFRVNAYVTSSQQTSDVAPGADGGFVVVWESEDQLGPGAVDAFGQRFAGPGLTLTADGSCPGLVTVGLSNAPPNTEIAVLAAANTNGFVKGGQICNGTEFELGEPFQLPPTFVIVGDGGSGSANLDLGANGCFLQALALADCSTSNTVEVPAAND